MDGLLGTVNVGHTGGGTNWPGVSFAPETGVVYAQANNSQVTVGSIASPPAGFSDIPYQAGGVGPEPGCAQAGWPDRASPRPAGGAPRPPTGLSLTTVEGLLLVKPPYGVLSAIDVNNGDLLWQVPHGETPDAVRNHPKLKGMNIPRTGQGASVGLIVTKSLVILGDAQVPYPGTRPRGAMLRAYDKKTGADVGEVLLPAGQCGSPMTYSIDSGQYEVVSASGGNYTGEFIALTLPDSELPRRTAQ